jgi:periplasmic divalent cation tolerance protein
MPFVISEGGMATGQPADPSPLAGHLLITTTLPTEAEAQAIADSAVQERLAACAQVQGPIRSAFRWEGAVDHATEWYCHFKTTRECLPALEALITKRHPYAVPEIIATPIVGGSAAYLNWIEGATGPG